MSARPRRSKAKSLHRNSETTPVRTTFRIYTEGVSTEPEYIDALKRLPDVAGAVTLDISIERAGVGPMTLVESARTDKKKSSSDIDHYWCVYDVESPVPHPHLDRARQMARDNGIHLAVSNPCFELWLVLHFRSQTAFLTTEEAVALRATLDQSDGKHLDGDLYMPRRQTALRRAEALRRKHRDDGTRFPDDNPSTSFDASLSQVMGAAKSRTPAAASRDSGPPAGTERPRQR